MTKRGEGLRRWVRIGLGLAGTAFLLVAMASQWDTVKESVVFSWMRFALAVCLILVSIFAFAHGWARLFDDAPANKRLRRVFFLAQPSKYIPGGVVQPIGQVALTTAEGIPAGRSATAFLVHSLASAAAGASIGIGVVLTTGTPTIIRLLAALGLLGPLLVWRPLLLRTATFVARVLRRELDEDLIPRQNLILRTYVWAVFGLISNGIAFAILSADTFGVPTWSLISAFSFAFTVGFIAIPFPAGVGIREAVLAATFPTVGLAPVVAISALHRLATMVGELIVVGGTTSLRRSQDSDASEQAGSS